MMSVEGKYIKKSSRQTQNESKQKKQKWPTVA